MSATLTSRGLTVCIEARKRAPFLSTRMNWSPGLILSTLEMCLASGPTMEQNPSFSSISSTKNRLKFLFLMGFSANHAGPLFFVKGVIFGKQVCTQYLLYLLHLLPQDP